MPILCKKHQSASSSLAAYTNLLAFHGLGLDIVGKIPKSVGGHEYMFVAIDKFTKWVEVMPVPRQTAQAAIKFIEGIIFRFEVPNKIITEMVLSSQARHSSSSVMKWESKYASLRCHIQDAMVK